MHAACAGCLATAWEPVCAVGPFLTFANACYARCNGVEVPEAGTNVEGFQRSACAAREWLNALLMGVVRLLGGVLAVLLVAVQQASQQPPW